MRYTIKDLSKIYMQDEKWIKDRLREFMINPISVVKVSKRNSNVSFYSSEQKNLFSECLESMKKRHTRVVIIEHNYHIFESKINSGKK